MTAPAISDVDLLATAVRNPGRLVIGPTSTTSPYGGTTIGVRRDCDIRWLTEYQDVRDPMSGALLKRIRRSIEIPYMRFLLELPFDQNALNAAFNASTPAGSLTFSPPETRINGSVIPQAVVSALASQAPLALIADDPRLPSVYFLMAIPKLVEDVSRFSMSDKALLVVDFEPIPTADTGDPGYPYVGSKPWFQIGRFENVVL